MNQIDQMPPASGGIPVRARLMQAEFEETFQNCERPIRPRTSESTSRSPEWKQTRYQPAVAPLSTARTAVQGVGELAEIEVRGNGMEPCRDSRRCSAGCQPDDIYPRSGLVDRQRP